MFYQQFVPNIPYIERAIEGFSCGTKDIALTPSGKCFQVAVTGIPVAVVLDTVGVRYPAEIIRFPVTELSKLCRP